MKVGKLIIPENEKRLHVDYTDYVVYSYDRDNFVFRFAFESYPETNGTAYLLIKADDIADQQFNLTITNKRAEWLVPERLLGYEGHVKGYLYLTENDLVKSEDAYMYTFLMRRSELDANVLELESLYFEKFEDLVVKMDLRVTELLYQSNVVFSEFQSFTALKKQEIANLDVDISADVDVIYQNLLTFYSESKNLMTQEVERVADKKVLTYIEMENLLKSASSSTETMLYNIQEKILEAEIAKDSAVNTMNEMVNQLLQLIQQAETILGGIIRDKIYTKTGVDELLSQKVTSTQVDQAITSYDRDVQIALRDKVSTQSFEAFKTTNSNILTSITDGNGVKEIVNARNDTKGIVHVDLGSRLDTNENLVSNIEVEIDGARGDAETLGERLDESDAQLAEKANKADLEFVDQKVTNTAELVHEKDQLTNERIDSLVESGSNSNGRWMKFADGTMICTVTKQTNDELTYPWGQLFRTGSTRWVYPIPFLTVPQISAFPASGASYTWVSIGQSASLNSECDFGVFSADKRTGVKPFVSATAIGRWK